MPNSRVFLFLQGPISPFFKRLAERLESMGHRTLKINICFGDQLLWKHKSSLNYRGKLKNWNKYILDIYKSQGVTDVLLLGEQRDYHKIAIHLAKENNIQVIATDFGYLRPDWITFEKNGMSAESLFPRTPESIFKLAERCTPKPNQPQYQDSFFNQAFWDVIYHFSSIFGAFMFPGYDNFRRHNPVQDYIGILIRLLRRKKMNPRAKKIIQDLTGNDIKYFVYPLQLQHDYSIQAYSPYSGNEQPMDDILRSFAHSAPKDVHLVVKIHPLDPSPFKWRTLVRQTARRLKIDGRVHFMDGGNLGTLVFSAQGAITINSTTGIATIREGIATKILGEAIYDVEGLVSKQSLDEFWSNPQHPDIKLRNAFIKALAGTVQIRGTYYNQPGLNAAIEAAAERLDKNIINEPI